MSNHSHHHTRKRKKRIRNAVSVVLSFVLSIFFAILMCAVALQFGFLDRDMILAKINESNYYNEVYAELTDNIHTILKSKGLPETLLEDCISNKRVYINGKQYIDNGLQGEDTVVELDNIKEEMNKILVSYYEEKQIPVDDKVRDNIDTVINDVCTEYTRMVRFQFVSFIKDYKSMYRNIAIWLLPLLVVLSAVIIFTLLKIHRYPHRGVRYTAISLASASMLNLCLPLYCLINKVYNRLDILPVYYEQFLQSYMENSLWAYVYVGAFGLLLTAILCGGVRVLKHNIS